MKQIIFLVTLFIALPALAQQKATDQKKRLAQYIGHWVGGDIKMDVIPKMDGASLQVEVYQKKDSSYQLILVELISYDAVTDQIIAAGQNAAGACFTGKGFFDTGTHWYMEDYNFKGEPTLKVTFNFIGSRVVELKGDVPGGAGWQVRYVKTATAQP
jgi:hypothetical protein